MRFISTSRLSRTTSWKVDPPSTRRKADSMIGPSRERTMRSSRTDDRTAADW